MMILHLFGVSQPKKAPNNGKNTSILSNIIGICLA